MRKDRNTISQLESPLRREEMALGSEEGEGFREKMTLGSFLRSRRNVGIRIMVKFYTLPDPFSILANRSSGIEQGL